jgi:hypothetical protein
VSDLVRLGAPFSMSPTPEPDHSGNLSDEEMPQQPPIFLSSSSDEEQEEPNPDYPAGYMPIGHHIEVQVRF